MTDVLALTAMTIGSRFVGALSLAGAAQLKSKRYNNKHYSNKKLSQSRWLQKETLTRVQAEKAFALTTQQSLSAQLRLAAQTEQRSRIRNELSANSARIAALTRQETLKQIG